MLKKIIVFFFLSALSASNQIAYSRITHENPVKTETLTSNRLYQNWLEWQRGFDLAELETSKNWTKPGNAAHFAWTQASNVRSFGEIYEVTGDVDWLERMAEELDVIFAYRGDVAGNTPVDYFTCYGLTLYGWKEVTPTSPASYSAVHQGMILIAFLEYVKHVRSLDHAPQVLETKANAYEAYAVQVMSALDQLYSFKQHAGKTVGYYKATKVRKTPCSDPPEFRVGPHNQTLVMGTVLDLLVQLGLDNDQNDYETKIVEIARGLKLDLTIPNGANHYEWPYWPSFSEVYQENGDDKAEDISHGALDIEFVVAVHQSGYSDGGSKLFSTTDIGRFVATMTDRLNRGDENFAFRVNGQLTTYAKNQGKINSIRPAWALLGQYHRPILDIGDRRCTNNGSHANATLLRLGGLELSCPGWCPSSPGTAVHATFNSQTASNGWQKSNSAICNDNYGSMHHIYYSDDDPARLEARDGKGYFEIFEQENSDHTCNSQEFGSKDLALYRDISLVGDEPLIELAGFSRSKSTATSTTSAVTNRSAFFLDSDNSYSALTSTQDLNFVGIQDSFWQPFNVFLKPVGKTEIRAVVGMRDSWGSNHNQSLLLDELMICSTEYCGNDFCASHETPESCPTDCQLNWNVLGYDFQGGTQGWSSADIDGYSYSNVNGALLAEENAQGGTHNLDLFETAGLELAWHKDFERQSDVPVVLKGQVVVSTANANFGPVNNICVAVVDPSLSSYPVVVKRCQKWINTTSSGEHEFEYDFTEELSNNQLYRIVIGTFDSWGAFKGQTLEINSVEIAGLTELDPPTVTCGNNICETGENSQICSVDCPLQPRISSFDFSNGSQGWLNTSSNLYQYTVANGKLVGEEVSSGLDPNPPEAADLDINWYRDFDYGGQDNFRVSGQVRVFSNNSTTSAKTTRYCVALVAVDTNTMIPGTKECEHWPMTTDSGLQPFSFDYSALAQGQGRVRVVIGMPDSWSANREQKIEIMSIEVIHGME